MLPPFIMSPSRYELYSVYILYVPIAERQGLQRALFPPSVSPTIRTMPDLPPDPTPHEKPPQYSLLPPATTPYPSCKFIPRPSTTSQGPSTSLRTISQFIREHLRPRGKLRYDFGSLIKFMLTSEHFLARLSPTCVTQALVDDEPSLLINFTIGMLISEHVEGIYQPTLCPGALALPTSTNQLSQDTQEAVLHSLAQLCYLNFFFCCCFDFAARFLALSGYEDAYRIQILSYEFISTHASIFASKFYHGQFTYPLCLLTTRTLPLLPVSLYTKFYLKFCWSNSGVTLRSEIKPNTLVSKLNSEPRPSSTSNNLLTDDLRLLLENGNLINFRFKFIKFPAARKTLRVLEFNFPHYSTLHQLKLIADKNLQSLEFNPISFSTPHQQKLIANEFPAPHVQP